MIPDGYEQSGNPEYPWICPIRSCRQLFAAIQCLGSHFVAAHRGRLLNDNLDGTLSDRGAYITKNPKMRPKSYIVSQEPLGPSEPPMPDPSFPKSMRTHTLTADQEKIKTAETQTSHRASSLSGRVDTGLTSTPHAGQRPLLLKSPGKDLWSYILPLLGTDAFAAGPPIAQCRWLPKLLLLPRQRAIAWNTAWLQKQSRHGSFVAALPIDVLSILLQAVGEPAADPCDPCSQGSGPFDHCIVVPRALSAALRGACTGCANCIYMDCKAACRFYKNRPHGLRPAVLPRDVVEAVEDGREDLGGKDARQGRKRKMHERDDDADDADIDDEEDQDSSNDGDALDQPVRKRPAPSVAVAPAPAASCPSLPPMASHPAAMALEEWELAPGRLALGGAPGETVAYSQCYTRMRMVRVEQDVTCRVDALRPGEVARYTAGAEEVRYCTVCAGKVRVKVGGGEEVDGKGGEQQFAVGQFGLFKVPRGRVVTVTNLWYAESVLCVNTSRVG